MFSSANKISKTTPAVQQKAAGSTFFRKAGEDSFFASSKEKPSFFGNPIQTKLTVSTPDDPQEKEADAVAQKVMTMPQPAMETVQSGRAEEKLGRKEEEHEGVQLKAEMPTVAKTNCKADATQLYATSSGTISRLADTGIDRELDIGSHLGGGQNVDRKKISLYQSDILRKSGRGPPVSSIPFEQRLSSSKGRGIALPDDTRTFMESRFNADFSGVRIHTDAAAQQLCARVHAQAFAHGSDIYFNTGKYAPQTTEGRTLLAHELTHTIQQGASKSGAPKKSAPKPVGVKRQAVNISRLPDAHSSTEGEQLIQTKTLSGSQPVYRRSTQPVHNATATSADAGSLVGHKHTQDDSAIKQGVAQLQPATTQSLTTPFANATKASTLVANSAALANKGLQSKQEEPLAEDKKHSSKIQPDVHIRQKGIINHAKQIQCCPCGHGGEGEIAMQQKERPQAAYIANTNAGVSEAYITTAERGPPLTVQRTGEKVQRSVIDDALSFVGSLTDCIPSILDPNLAEAIHCAKGKAQQVAMHIPGYKALRVVLAEDPITGEAVERNGHNFIEAAFDLVPGGDLIHKKLDEVHKLDAAAAWIDGKIATVVGLVSGLKTAIVNFWDSIGITDIASPMDVLRRGAGILIDFVGKVIDFAIDTAKDFLKMIKDFLLDKIVDFIKNETTAYPLLTVILGKDPITEKEVPRNGTTILNALLDLGGDEGKEQKKQMQDTGTFAKAVGFIDEGIKVFGTAYADIVAAFHNIWDAVSIESLMDPAGTFAKIYNGFAGPISRVLDFVKKVGAEILKFVKEVLMIRLSAWAKTVRGYSLITVIIGKDPFTGAEVPRNVENIIHGFMSLMDGGEEQFQQMKDSGAIAKAEQKINAAVKQLNLTPQAIIQLFIDLWNSFSINDLAHPIAAFERILAKFGEPIGRLISFVIEIIKIVVEVLLVIMQFPLDVVNNIIAKAMQAFQKIKSDPIGFLKNLLRAIKEGFMQFFGNILKHLLAGLTGWLMSELKDANVEAPKDFSLATIIGWVLKLLGITMEKIWDKLAKHPKIGPAKVAKIRGMIGKLEGIWTFIKDVQERGMAAIWDKIVEKLNDLWNTVLDAIKNWVMEQIVNKIVTKLLSMLDPTGIMAVINSVIAIYKAIQSFIKYLKEMLQIVNSFVEGVVEIANGNTKKAADFLEGTLAKGVPVVIGFLANQVGLGGVGKKVGEMIEKVRDMVDNALTWLVNKAVDTGLGLLDKVMGAARDLIGTGGTPEERLDKGLTEAQTAVNTYAGKRVSSFILKPLLAIIKLKYGFQSLEVVPEGENWFIEGKVNPQKKVETAAQVNNDNKADDNERCDKKTAEPPTLAVGVLFTDCKKTNDYFEITGLSEGKVEAQLIDVCTRKAIENTGAVKRTLSTESFWKYERLAKPEEIDKKCGNIEEKDVAPFNYENGQGPPSPYTRSWKDYDTARTILNWRLRAHKFNPDKSHQWEHLIEQSQKDLGSAINTLENIYLSKTDDNKRLNELFSTYSNAMEVLKGGGEDSKYLIKLIEGDKKERTNISPREYLSKISDINEHIAWKKYFYKKLRISAVESDKNKGRGPYRTMSNVDL